MKNDSCWMSTKGWHVAALAPVSLEIMDFSQSFKLLAKALIYWHTEASLPLSHGYFADTTFKTVSVCWSLWSQRFCASQISAVHLWQTMKTYFVVVGITFPMTCAIVTDINIVLQAAKGLLFQLIWFWSHCIVFGETKGGLAVVFWILVPSSGPQRMP